MKLHENKSILAILFIASAILLFSGCKSNKIVTTGGVLKSKTQEEVISDALASQLQYKTLYTKGSISFGIGNSSRRSSAVYKIIRDSVIQTSIRPILGMEAFRITFTPDSIVIMDRMKKKYTTVNIKELGIPENFNFYNLQALFTNELFIPGRTGITPADYKNFNVTAINDTYLLSTRDSNNGHLAFSFTIDASDRILSTLAFSPERQGTIEWSYKDFIRDNNNNLYPTTMTTRLNINKKRVNMDIAYNSLDIDKELDIDTSIPSKYEKTSFSKLIGPYF